MSSQASGGGRESRWLQGPGAVGTAGAGAVALHQHSPLPTCLPCPPSQGSRNAAHGIINGPFISDSCLEI